MENGHSIGLHWTTLLTGRKGLLFERASRIALALFLSWLSIVQAADFTGQVVRVLDGDTFEVLHNQHPERIRLSGSQPSYDAPPCEASICCRASFQRLLFCFLVLSLVGCEHNPPRKPHEQARESREEVEKKLEDATNQVFAEFTRSYNADSTWQESFTRSPVWTMKLEDRLIPASLWPLTRSRKLKQETTARQVHLDSGTYRNGAGPTHFHQFGTLLFLRL